MKFNEISSHIERIYNYATQGRFFEAFQHITGLASMLSLVDVVDKAKDLETTYGYVLRYAMENVRDDSREPMLEQIKEGILSLLDEIDRRSRLIDNSSDIYSNTLRLENAQAEKLIDYMTKFLEGNRAEEKPLAMEAYVKNIFDFVWVSHKLSKNELAMLKECVAGEGSDSSINPFFISALMLGALKYYDSNRIATMLDIYAESDDLNTRAVALTAALLVIMHWPSRSYTSVIKNKIREIAAREGNEWVKNVREVITELMRTKETEHINKKISEDVIPAIMKMGPNLRKNFDGLDESEIFDLQENPQWQELMDKSGLGKNLEELNRLQIEGADVMMSTFGHLKTFPFFRDMRNWFMPFQKENVTVKRIMDSLGRLGDFFLDSTTLCDSDKYSLVFSLDHVPENQKQMMINGLNEQMKAMGEMSGHDSHSFKMYVNRYIQNLYRFFKLFPRKGEFDDPFLSIPRPTEVKLLKPYVDDVDFLQLIAEFNFKYGYWKDALDLFSRLDELQAPTAYIYQKMGYCQQKLGNIDAALTDYLQADLLDDGNSWTIRRIAYCYRMTGKMQSALDYYKKLDEIKPDDVSIILQISKCLMELNRYKDAINYLYKADYLEPDSLRVLRPLAWSLLMEHNIEGSRKQYFKIIEAGSSAEDLMNIGHSYLIEKDYHTAIDYYLKGAAKGSYSKEKVTEVIKNDFSLLIFAGAEKEILSLLPEVILYEMSKSTN